MKLKLAIYFTPWLTESLIFSDQLLQNFQYETDARNAELFSILKIKEYVKIV